MVNQRTKKLLIYREGIHIQTVTYVKSHGVWVATHFIRDKYMPFALYTPLSSHKEQLLLQGLTWKWV